MTNFAVGDHVLIARQPLTMNANIALQGRVGRITELREGELPHAVVQTFRTSKNNPGVSGEGGVPLDCLDHFTSPALRASIEAWTARVKRIGEEIQERAERKAERRKKLREDVAAIAHEQWRSICLETSNTLQPFMDPNTNVRLDITPKEARAARTLCHWTHLVNTPYADLTEEDKERYRVWADKTLTTLDTYLEGEEKHDPANY